MENGRAPWIDPYSFQPEASPRLNFGGWPFGLPYWPVEAAFGPVIAWNLLILLSFVAAGLFALAWLRQLGLGRGAALVGGLAFALGPYRVAQSTGHFRGPISILLPLALFAFERALKGSRWWAVLAGAALASIPFSDVHLALAAMPFFLLYVALRAYRKPRALVAGLAAGVAGIGGGALVASLTIPGSITGGGRSLAEVEQYSASGRDFDHAARPHGLESFVFLGWLLPLLALAGLGVLIWTRRYALAVVLGIGAVVPVLLALGTNLPLYSTLWRHFPPLRFPRVPERLMPVAVLCIAALAAFAVSKIPSRVIVPAVVVVALFFDLHVRLFQGLPADGNNQAYVALRAAAGGPARRAPRLPARAQRGKRLPVLRHAGLARAARRILDGGAEVGRRHGAAAAPAQLRGLERASTCARPTGRALRGRAHGPVRGRRAPQARMPAAGCARPAEARLPAAREAAATSGCT